MTRAASRPVPRSGNQAVVPATVDDLLIEARGGLARLDPVAAFRATRGGAVLIDTRPEWQRRAGGEIPGAIVIERNHLEWRCDPSSPAACHAWKPPITSVALLRPRACREAAASEEEYPSSQQMIQATW